ncbi:MAG TPA: ATP-binding cassette domain-containing protein [Burkholderiales bacterium]|jgi:osmoprotectant transport system ATP-binding protein|nr:ATP-binding cassette domain-containing protein [Burkholderiales bacterium]
MTLVSLDGVSKSYGGVPALAPISMEFPAQRVVVLIGPSGCGKSTLLRMIVGLVAPDTGRITIGGEALTKENAARLRHGIGYVIQEGGLFPHLTAEENVALLPRFLRREGSWIASRLAELAELAQLPAASLKRYPRDLSGGQRQRVGIMRALMLDPPLLLLDEPLGALDPITRYELQGELKRIFAALGKTVVLVTHDMHEAAYFADDIVLMREGRVVQRGSAADLLERPAEPFVRDFLRAQRAGLPPT